MGFAECQGTHSCLQGLLKKHEAFETDFTVHRDRVNDVCANGEELIKKVWAASDLSVGPSVGLLKESCLSSVLCPTEQPSCGQHQCQDLGSARQSVRAGEGGGSEEGQAG